MAQSSRPADGSWGVSPGLALGNDRTPVQPRPAVGLRLEIFPRDLDASVRFYVQVLGFRLVRDERELASRYVALERSGVRVGAAARPPVERPDLRRPPTGVEMVLEVDDVVAEHDHVQAAGWPMDEDLKRRPWRLTDFRLLDPDGYLLRITSRD